MNKIMLSAVTLLTYSCLSFPAFAQKVTKEVSDKQINEQQIQQTKEQGQLGDYYTCTCQCVDMTIDLPLVKDCSAYNGTRCIPSKPENSPRVDAIPKYSACVKTKKK
jgi:hypothetical protein